MADGTDDTTTPASPAEQIALRMGSVSPLWQRWLRAQADTRARAEAIAAGDPALALGVEAVWEGYALHFATSRTLDDDGAGAHARMLVGDWCYAAGLCDVAATGSLDAVSTLADLIADVAELAGGSRRRELVRSGAALPLEQLAELRWDEAITQLGRHQD
jgi:hypothetical protein